MKNIATLLFVLATAIPGAGEAQAKRWPHPFRFHFSGPDDCIGVKMATETTKDDEMERVVTGPYYISPGGVYVYLFRLTTPTDDGTYLMVSYYFDKMPNLDPTTAYAKGGIELEVEHSYRRLRASEAVIRMNDELVQQVIEVGALDAQVSFGSTNILLRVPANYFLGFSEKADMGWGECPRPDWWNEAKDTAGTMSPDTLRAR